MISRLAVVAACAAVALVLLGGAGGVESAAVARARANPAAPKQQPPVGSVGKKRLLIVGDSVIQGLPAYGGVATLQALLGPGWNPPVIDAAESRSTLAAPPLVQADLQDIAPSTFDTVIIALGYNDAGTASVFEGRVRAVLDLLRNVPHVYWLTLREFGQYADGYHQANVGLRSIITSYPNAAILDWNEFSQTLPDSEFTVDGNHLSPNLAQVMAAFIADAVNGKSRYRAIGPSATATSAPPSSAPSNAISTVSSPTPGATGEHNSLLIGLLVGGVLAGSFAIAAWAGSRRMRARESDERRTHWDEMFGITEDDDVTSTEAAEEDDTADLDDPGADESATASREETEHAATVDDAVGDAVAEPTPVDAPLPPRDDIP